MAEATEATDEGTDAPAPDEPGGQAGRASPRARQDHPRRGGQRRPSRPRPRRRRGRGLSRDRPQRPVPGPIARGPAGERGRRRPRDGRRPRLRQPVRAAHRPARPRARRLLGAAPARHAVRRARAARRARDHPVGRPQLGLRPGRAAARSGHLVGPHPGPRDLLRRPADGPRARWRRHPVRPSRVRPGQRQHHRGRPAVRRHRARAAGLDEPRRLDLAPARGLPRHRPDRFDAVRRPGRRVAQPVRHPVPSRGRPHAARPGRPAQLRGRHRRDRADLDGRQLHRHDRRRTSASGSTATPRRPARTGWSSARCRAASIRRSRRRSSIARSAIG